MANTDVITRQGKGEKEETIKFSDRKTVYVTKSGAGYGHAEGEELELHPKQAEDWVVRGLATDKPATKK